MKDQIGSFFYFPSINFQKAAGGFGAIRVNNQEGVKVPFPKPEAEFDLLIGDWYEASYKVTSLIMSSLYVLYLYFIHVTKYWWIIWYYDVY